MSALDLNTLSGPELAVALRAGKFAPTDLVAHLANRALPTEEFCTLLPTIPAEYHGAVMLAQMSLMQKPAAKPALPPVRVSVTEKGRRLVCVQPPKSCDGYMLTNPPASWLWILDNAAMIRTAVAEAEAIPAETVAKMAADKLVKKAAAK